MKFLLMEVNDFYLKSHIYYVRSHRSGILIYHGMNLLYNWEIQVLRISHRDTSIAHFGYIGNPLLQLLLPEFSFVF